MEASCVPSYGTARHTFTGAASGVVVPEPYGLHEGRYVCYRGFVTTRQPRRTGNVQRRRLQLVTRRKAANDMIDRYVQLNRAIRVLARRVHDLNVERFYDKSSDAVGIIGSYVLMDAREVERLLPDGLTTASVEALRAAVAAGGDDDMRSIIEDIIPSIEDDVDNFFSRQPVGDIRTGVLDLLHPVVIASSYQQFRAGLYRDAVLNAILAISDLIRHRTGLDIDGAQLAARAFAVDNPLLMIAALETESGRNDQKGFIQLLQGAYLGIRNPNAHSLLSELSECSAAQHLVFASILAGRIADAKRTSSPLDSTDWPAGN